MTTTYTSELFQNSLSKTFNNTKDKHLLNSLTKIEDKAYKIPPKIQKIEASLSKYKEEKYKHLLEVKQLKDEEILREKAAVLSLSDYERTKLTNNKTYIQEKKREQYQNWKKNQETKEKRLFKEQQLEDFLTNRLKGKVLAQNSEDHAFNKESMDYFQLNCQKLGVELKHDPERKAKPEKAKFSAVAAMMKIKERKKQADYAKKERDVRRRKIQVEQERLSKETDAKKAEENLIDAHVFLMKQNHEKCEEKWKNQQQKEIISTNRVALEEEIAKKMENYRAEKQKTEKELNKQLEIERAEDYRRLFLEYREKNLEKRMKKQEIHKEICANIMNFVLDLTDICYRENLQRSELFIESTYWTSAMNKFLDNKPLITTKKFDIFEARDSSMVKSMGLASRMSEDDVDQEMNDYLFNLNDWDPAFHLILDDDAFETPQNNPYLGEILFGLIENIFPKKPQLPKPDFPEHLPVKLSLLGVPFAGKKTFASLLRQKYGIEAFSPEDVIKEAIAYAFPVEEPVDPKKTNTKKKTNEKKSEETNIVKDLPELRALGMKAKEANELYSDEILVEAVIVKVKCMFPLKQNEELQAEIKEEKNKASEKLKELKRLQEEAEKKAKKTSKVPSKSAQKGKNAAQVAVVEEVQQTPEEKLQELINKNPYYYTKGFALINFPRSQAQARLLEEKLTGHVDLQERKNPDGEFQKQRVGVLSHPNENSDSVEEDLQSGLDFLVCLSIELEEMARRIQGRRIDPQTKTIYHVEDNPPPVDVKGLNERLMPVVDEFSEGNLQSIYQDYAREIEIMRDWYGKFYRKNRQTQEKLCVFQEISSKGKLYEVFERIEGIMSPILAEKHELYEILLGETPNVGEIREENEEKKNNEAEEPRNTNKLAVFEAKAIDINSSKLLWQFWDETQNNYLQDIYKSLIKIKENRLLLIRRVKDLQRNFLEILEKKDNHLLEIERFQDNFNHFIEENPGMIKEKSAKEYISKHLDTLYESLWAPIELRKDTAITERKSIVSSGWIEEEMERICGDIQLLMQIEINKLLETLLIIQNFFAFFENAHMGDFIEHLIIDPFSGDHSNVEMENQDGFPKLRLIYENAAEIIGKSIAHIQSNKKLKKPNSKKKNEAFSLISPEYVEQLNARCLEVMSKEQELSLRKVKKLHFLAISRLKELRVLASGLFNKLDDWIINGIKLENQEIYTYISLLRASLHNGTKSHVKLQEHAPVSQIYKPLNYLSLNPYVFPIFEEKIDDRLLITQAKVLLEDIKSLAFDEIFIDKKVLEEYFLRRRNNEENIMVFPKVFLQIDIRKSFEKIEFNGTNLVKWKVFLNSLLLLKEKIVDEEKIQEFKESIGKNEINYEEFLQSDIWFDEGQKEANIKENVLIQREKFVKKLMWEINAKPEQELLNVDALLGNFFKGNSKDLTHFEALFN